MENFKFIHRNQYTETPFLNNIASNEEYYHQFSCALDEMNDIPFICCARNIFHPYMTNSINFQGIKYNSINNSKNSINTYLFFKRKTI